jgi:DNA-binding NarL/FixJ family response regulator
VYGLLMVNDNRDLAGRVDEGADLVASGRRALAAGDWEGAYAVFESVLEGREFAAGLDGYGLALWFLGRVDEGMEARARAYAKYVVEGDRDRAARVAVWISHQYLMSGRASVASGWLERAERALEGRTDCAGYGWVLLERARGAANVEEAAVGARRAMAIGRSIADDDLEVFALSLIGRCEISAGSFDEGMRKLEEAMAAASAGRIDSPCTLGEAYCNLIVACTNAGDWERASEWCEHVDDYARRYAIMPLFGVCRTIHADVLLASGRWDDAETALADALEVHARHDSAMGALTVSTLASLRIRQGRLAEAAQLLTGCDEHPRSLLALAELRLAEGEPDIAAALLERGLAAAEGDLLTSSRLLGPLVDAHLTRGRNGAAIATGRQLVELADKSGRLLVQARSFLATARVALADTRRDDAREYARLALESFGRLQMPHEVAEARLELARAVANDLPPLAREEARSAFNAFRELGAARGMDVAAAALRDFGAGTAPRVRVDAKLTARESEVLLLVASGRSNAQIAQTLFISQKTAGHHVSRILSKLGVRNRTEAAAHATRLEPSQARTMTTPRERREIGTQIGRSADVLQDGSTDNPPVTNNVIIDPGLGPDATSRGM